MPKQSWCAALLQCAVLQHLCAAALLQHFMLLQGSSCPAPNAIDARYSPIISGAYCAHLCSPWAPYYRPAVPSCSNELLLCCGRNSSTCVIYVCHGFRIIYESRCAGSCDSARHKPSVGYRAIGYGVSTLQLGVATLLIDADGENRHNFNRAASTQGVTPACCCHDAAAR
jgi:hypothetical protein